MFFWFVISFKAAVAESEGFFFSFSFLRVIRVFLLEREKNLEFWKQQ